MKSISAKLTVIIMIIAMAVTMLPSVLWADDAEYGYFTDEWSEEYYEEPQAFDEVSDGYMDEEFISGDYLQEAENVSDDQDTGAPGEEDQITAPDIVEVSGYSGVYFYSDFQKAVDQAENDDVIRLISDVKLEKELVFSRDIRVTIDLNGFNILLSDHDGDKAYIRIEKGDITIKDSSEDEKSVIDSHETDHGAIMIIDDDTSDIKLEITGGIFNTKNDVDFLSIEKDKETAGTGIPDDPENVEVKISGGYFTEEPDAVYMEKGYEALVVPDGYWEIAESPEGVPDDEIMVIDDPEDDMQEGDNQEVDDPEYDMSQVEYYSDQESPEEDHTDEEQETPPEFETYQESDEEQETSSEFESIPETDESETAPEFETYPETDEQEETEPEIVETVEVSGISGVYNYSDFQKAIDQAEEGDLFRLINNVILTNPLIFNRDLDLTLDLNGYSIVMGEGEYDKGSIRIEQGNITIMDNSADGTGFIDSTSTWEPAIVMLDNGWQPVNLIVYGGNFRAAEGTDCISVDTLDGQPGEFGGFANIEIDGGSFSKDVVIPEPETIPEPVIYTVTWADWDGSVLKQEGITEGEMPDYGENVPARSEDEDNIYTFTGWSPEVTAAEGDAVYTAVYAAEAKIHTYTVTWADWNGSVLKQEGITEGEMPDYGENVPARSEDEDNIYTFTGWSPEVTAAEGDAVYTAVYAAEAKIHTYTVTWADWDGSVLKQEGITEGEMPDYGENVPARSEDEDNIYTFTGWSPEVTVAEGDAVYTAVYAAEAKIHTYTVTWADWDGSVLKQEGITEGEMPDYGENVPARSEDEDNIYTFTGWSPEVTVAEGDAVYTAVYAAEAKIHTYTITWLNWEGTLLGSDELNEGQTPFYGGETPHRDDTDEYTYEFAGWDPEIVPAEKDAVYTAVINENIRQYDLVWVPNGGRIDNDAEYTKAGAVDAGQEIIAPEVHKDGYTLDGWFTEDEDGKEEWIFDEDVVDSDIILFAEWTEDPTEAPTTKEPATTEAPTTKVPETTKAQETTKVPETTRVPETTEAPTTKAPETTKAQNVQNHTDEQENDRWIDDAQAEVQGMDVQNEVINNVPADGQPVYMDEIAAQENEQAADIRTQESGPAEPEAASRYVEEPTTPAPPYHDPIEYTTSRVASNATTAEKSTTEKKAAENVTTTSGSKTTVQPSAETYQTTGRTGHNSMVIWIIVVAAALVGICVLIVLLINRRGRR